MPSKPPCRLHPRWYPLALDLLREYLVRLPEERKVSQVIETVRLRWRRKSDDIPSPGACRDWLDRGVRLPLKPDLEQPAAELAGLFDVGKFDLALLGDGVLSNEQMARLGLNRTLQHTLQLINDPGFHKRCEDKPELLMKLQAQLDGVTGRLVRRWDPRLTSEEQALETVCVLLEIHPRLKDVLMAVLSEETIEDEPEEAEER